MGRGNIYNHLTKKINILKDLFSDSWVQISASFGMRLECNKTTYTMK